MAETAGACRSPSRPAMLESLRERIRLWTEQNFARLPTPERMRDVLRIHARRSRRIDRSNLIRAYHVAEEMHEGQMRKSGEPYITHPVAVTKILAELGLDSPTLVAALLHDTVEDTEYTLEELRDTFGEEVAHLVDGVTKLEKVDHGNCAEAETLRKMLIAAGQDVRVLLIKLADRTHNMRTIAAKSRKSQIRIAKATRDIFIPLAGRLGMQNLKRELADLAIGTLEPELFDHVRTAVAVDERNRQKRIATAMQRIVPLLRSAKLHARVLDRPRHLASVLENLEHRSLEYAVRDTSRLVIVLDGSPEHCYDALGIVHGVWQPVPGKFKDFIAEQKFNLYQSLHTTVLGPEDTPIDVLIRTEKMHEVAELGVAARTTLRKVAAGPESAATWAEESQALTWLQQLVTWQDAAPSPIMFSESLRLGLSDHEIAVFVNNTVIRLPERAVVLDLVCALSEYSAQRCVGVRLNNRHIAALTSTLSDGDVVEVIYGKNPTKPQYSWLRAVRTPLARTQIAGWLSARNQPLPAQRRGEGLLRHALGQRGRHLASYEPLELVRHEYRFPTCTELITAIGAGTLSAEEVADRLIDAADTVVTEPAHRV